MVVIPILIARDGREEGMRRSGRRCALAGRAREKRAGSAVRGARCRLAPAEMGGRARRIGTARGGNNTRTTNGGVGRPSIHPDSSQSNVRRKRSDAHTQ